MSQHRHIIELLSQIHQIESRSYWSFLALADAANCIELLRILKVILIRIESMPFEIGAREFIRLANRQIVLIIRQIGAVIFYRFPIRRVDVRSASIFAILPTD